MATDTGRVLEWAAREGEYPLPAEPDATGTAVEPDCGDNLTMGFKTHREIITEIGFDLTKSACPPTRACAVCAASSAQWVLGTSENVLSVPISSCGIRDRMVTNSARVIFASGRKEPSS